jgi:hypothetical protein
MFRTIVRQSKPRSPIDMVNELFGRLREPEAILVNHSNYSEPAGHVAQTASSYAMRRRRSRRLAIHTGTNIRSTWF